MAGLPRAFSAIFPIAEFAFAMMGATPSILRVVAALSVKNEKYLSISPTKIAIALRLTEKTASIRATPRVL